MRTIPFIFLITLTVPLSVFIGTVAIVLNAIALIVNPVAAVALLLFWRCGDRMVCRSMNRIVRLRASRVPSMSHAIVN